MPFFYIVRCNFTVPEREAAWNAWYDGPKMQQMLANPGFLGCQRFKRASGTGRGYLALWTVRSPEALASEQYEAQWGFSEWTPLVTDWSRELFDAREAEDDALAVAPDGALRAVTFDGLGVDEALAVRATMAPPAEMLWLPVIGLDRHTPLIGLAAISDLTDTRLPDGAAPAQAQQAVYRPISEFHEADRRAE
jgi:hypothetical protein